MILDPLWPLSMHQSNFLASFSSGTSVEKWSHHWVFSGKVYLDKWAGGLKTVKWVLELVDPGALLSTRTALPQKSYNDRFHSDPHPPILPASVPSLALFLVCPFPSGLDPLSTRPGALGSTTSSTHSLWMAEIGRGEGH